jgi:hypothetical protein
MDDSLGFHNRLGVRVAKNPCLQGLEHFINTQNSRRMSVIRYGDFDSNSGALKSIVPADPFHLSSIMNIPSDSIGRLVLVEDISATLLSELGSLLDLDPLFLAGHVSTDFGDIENVPPPPSIAMFPTQLVAQGFLHLNYHQVLDLGPSQDFENAPYAFHTDCNIPRNVRRLPKLSDRQLALARTCCSVVVKQFKESWICKMMFDNSFPSAQHLTIKIVDRSDSC